MNIKFLIYVLIASILFPIIKPENNTTINYIHVLFEWEEISNVSEYNLIVTSNNTTILNTTTSNFYYVEEQNINWETNYAWKVCDSSNSSICTEEYYFTTGAEIELENLQFLEMNSTEYYNGITIFGNISNQYSIAIDKDGRQIWNSGGEYTFSYFNYDQQGRFYGGKFTDGNGVPGIEFDINGNILFE